MVDKAHIGRTWPPFETQVEVSRLRTFAAAIGETDPVYFDDQAARKAGYPAILAPVTFPYCFGFDAPDGIDYIGQLGIPLARILHGEQVIRTRGLLFAGDRVRCSRKVTDIYTKKNGALEFVAFETEIHKVATNELVAELLATLVVRNPT